MEFKLERPIEQLLPQSVNFNYEQLKAELQGSLEKYQNMVVTKDSIKDAKDDRAKLNKLRTSIDDQRKIIKKAWNVPYDAFEKKVKELTGLIGEPIATIDKQLAVYEDQRKAEKREEIEEYFDEKIGCYAGLIPFDKVFDPRWLNVSYDIKKSKAEIDDLIKRVEIDEKAIKDLEVECEQQMLDAYFQTLDLSAAMAEKKRFEDRIMQLAELEKQRQAKEQKAAEAKQQRPIRQKVSAEVPAPPVHTVEEKTWTIQFEVVKVSREQMMALKKCMIENNIQYRKIEEGDSQKWQSKTA